jgi:probable HAF family extracellular repeat protein
MVVILRLAVVVVVCTGITIRQAEGKVPSRRQLVEQIAKLQAELVACKADLATKSRALEASQADLVSTSTALAQTQFKLSNCQTDFVTCLEQLPSPPSYGVTDIGVLNLGSSVARGLNDAGDVVGWSSKIHPETGSRAFLWSNGLVTDLGTLGGTETLAFAINDNRRITGVSSLNAGLNQHAFFWENGVMVDLGLPEGSQPTGINNLGTISGSAPFANQDSFDTFYAVIWQNGNAIDLGLGTSRALAINNSGQVVGATFSGLDFHHAFLWADGMTTDLGTLGGETSFAYSINDLGQVVGHADTETGATHAFLWENGVMTDISSSDDVVPLDINNNGEMVGGVFVWKKGEKRQDLNKLIPSDSGWELLAATALNNRGQIVGYGYLNSQDRCHQRAFLLTPIR